MLKKVINTIITFSLAVVASYSWGDLIPTNSMFFFGEPEYPSEK